MELVRQVSTPHEHSQFHVSFHGRRTQVRAGDEGQLSVRNRALRMHRPRGVGDAFFPVSDMPNVKIRGGTAVFIVLKESTVTFPPRSVEDSHKDVHLDLTACRILQCLDYR